MIVISLHCASGRCCFLHICAFLFSLLFSSAKYTFCFCFRFYDSNITIRSVGSTNHWQLPMGRQRHTHSHFINVRRPHKTPEQKPNIVCVALIFYDDNSTHTKSTFFIVLCALWQNANRNVGARIRSKANRWRKKNQKKNLQVFACIPCINDLDARIIVLHCTNTWLSIFVFFFRFISLFVEWTKRMRR